MVQRVRKQLLWVAFGALALCAFLVLGDAQGWWPMLTASGDNGLLRFLDRGDKIVSILSGLTGMVALVLTIPRDRKAGTAPGRMAVAATRGWGLVNFFVDRSVESRQLRRALNDRNTRVIVVHGPAGVGKTELVGQVLEKAGIDAGWYLATPTFSPTSATLLNDLTSALPVANPSVPQAGEYPQGPLEAALRSRGTRRRVIVLDSVEWLLTDKGQLADLSLDEALQLIATGPRNGVKVVLISDRIPTAAANGDWGANACRILVECLPLEHFRTFVTRSAGGHPGLLSSLDDRMLTGVHRALGGRPRLAQLFDEVVEQGVQTTAHSLAIDVRAWGDRSSSIDAVGERLRRRMSDAFVSDRRTIYRAVAAFATPVTPETVTQLVDEDRSSDQRLGVDAVRRELLALCRHAIYTDDSERTFFLPPAEAHQTLDWRSEESRGNLPLAKQYLRLLTTAGEILRKRRQADRDGDWTGPQTALAEVNVWLHADRPEGALRAITELDRGAENGRPSMLFRQPRRLIAEDIDADSQSGNYAVLGYLDHVSGDLHRAKDDYSCALAAVPNGNPLWHAKILVNRAGLELTLKAPAHAYSDFEKARTLAPHDPAVLTGALTGMARCRRREGLFSDAAELLTKALRTAGNQPNKFVPVAARLLRLLIERAQLHDAEHLIEQIRENVQQDDDTVLRAIYLDALADLRLAQDRPAEAMNAAREAVQLALPVHDPVTALQARTTIGLIHLHRGNFKLAAREATLARRYSGNESLLVIAVQGVAFRRAGRIEDARRTFQELADQADIRITEYSKDFAAWLFQGVALSAHALDSPAELLDKARTAFKRARRRPLDPAPAIFSQILFLLVTLTTNGTEDLRLQAVTDDLKREVAHQMAARTTRTSGT